MNLAELNVKLAMDAAQYAQGLAQASKQTADFAMTVKRSFKDADGASQSISVTYKKAAKEAAQASQEAGKSAQSFGASVKGLAAELGLLYGLGQIVGLIKDFTAASYEAAKSQNDAKNALTSIVGGTAEYQDAVRQVKEATKGTVSETEAARTAFGLLDNGIAKSAEEAAQYALAGKALNSALGQTASYEKFLMLLDEGSPMLMNNFNITQSMVEAQQKLVEANTNLTGSQARLQAVREVALAKGLELANSISQETIATQQASAAYADFQAAFGQLVMAVDNATGTTTFLTTTFQNLTNGAKAWETIINEQIPAINAHTTSMAEQAAQAALNAKSQAELDAAWQQGRGDMEAFKSALIAGAGSVEEYNDIVKRGAQGNYFLADSLTMTASEFEKLKSVSDVAKATEDLGSAVTAAAATYGDVNSIVPTTIAKQLELADSANVAAAAFGGQVDAMTRANQLALATAKNMSPAINAAAGAFGGGQDAFTNQRTLAGFQQGGDQRLEYQKQAEQAAKEQEKASKAAYKSMTSSFNEAASQMRGTIESVIKPSLDEVWQPKGQEQHMDEWARRLATVSSAGFGSEWLTQLGQQFAGQDFFKPVADAMASGDEGALKAAADNILTNSVTKLWDVETIKAAVRTQLQQQQLREQIISQVQQELSAEGLQVDTSQISAIAGGAEQTAAQSTQGFTDTAQAVTDMGESFGTVQPAITGVDSELVKVYSETIPPLVKELDNLVSSLNGSNSGAKNLAPNLSGLGTAVNTKVIPPLKNLSSPILPDIKLGMQGVSKAIKEATDYFRSLASEVKKFSLPDVLTPGSPTPFEIGLRGITDALGGATAKFVDFNGAISKGNYDKLFGVDRSIVNLANVSQAAFGGMKKSFNSYIANSKAHLAQDMILKVFRSNAQQILSATDRLEAFKKAAKNAGVNFAGILGKTWAGTGERAMSDFLIAFDSRLAQARTNLENMILSASRSAIGLGEKLAGMAKSAIDLVNQDVNSLYTMLQTGAEMISWDGQILSNAQAQEVYNKKLQEQLAAQEQIAQLQKSQAQLDFLTKQLDLIEQAKKAGLNMSDVFGGLQFGTDAPLANLVEASNRIIQGLIGQVSTDLTSISPGLPTMSTLSGGAGGNVTNNTFNQTINSSTGLTNPLGQYQQARAVMGT